MPLFFQVVASTKDMHSRHSNFECPSLRIGISTNKFSFSICVFEIVLDKRFSFNGIYMNLNIYLPILFLNNCTIDNTSSVAVHTYVSKFSSST